MLFLVLVCYNRNMKQIEFINTIIYGAVTLKDATRPDQNNMALHVCNDEQGVLSNRKELEKITIPLENWALPWQKHTNHFYRVTSKDKGKGAFDKHTSIMDVDALYTTEPNVLIGVFTADCVGILLVDETTPCLCVIHSGWKGTVQQITAKTVDHLIQNQLVHPKTTQAFFSPSLQFDSLEVGMEVIEQIQKLPIDTSPFIRRLSNEKASFDNQGINAQMLINAGITKENIHRSSIDTLTDIDNGFSYRRNNRLKEFPKCGEHFTYGYIKEKTSH